MYLGDCGRAGVAAVWAGHNDWGTSEWLQHNQLSIHLSRQPTQTLTHPLKMYLDLVGGSQ